MHACGSENAHEVARGCMTGMAWVREGARVCARDMVQIRESVLGVRGFDAHEGGITRVGKSA